MHISLCFLCTQSYTVPNGGGTVSRIVTPRVQAYVRSHFGCSSLSGAQLEDQGGEGSAGSHWEYGLFQVRHMHQSASGTSFLPGGHCVVHLTDFASKAGHWLCACCQLVQQVNCVPLEPGRSIFAHWQALQHRLLTSMLLLSGMCRVS